MMDYGIISVFETKIIWHDIIRAPRANSVCANKLASEIENKYIHDLPPPPSSVSPQANIVSPATSSPTLFQSSCQ